MSNTEKSNKNKDRLLGMPHGTANGKLRKSIIFKLAGIIGMLACHRCGKPIEKEEDLSIEHKNPWQQAEDPKKAFFDLGNIAFSHLHCNCGAATYYDVGRANRDKNVCKNGHSLTGDNVYFRPNGNRACKACRAEGMRKFRGP